jgi:hypothetical protein
MIMKAIWLGMLFVLLLFLFSPLFSFMSFPSMVLVASQYYGLVFLSLLD